MVKLTLTIIAFAVFLGLSFWFLMHSFTDDERVVDYERIEDLKEKAMYEHTYFGKISDETLKEIEELEKKYETR